MASGVLRVVETHYETKTLPDNSGYMIRATVKADIDTDDLLTWFKKDAEEVIKLVAEDKAIRARETEQERKIETLKQEYVQAATPEQKEVIAAQILVEDKNFLSNLKLREGNRQRDAGNHKRAAEFFTAKSSRRLNLFARRAKSTRPWNFTIKPSKLNRGLAYNRLDRRAEAIADFDKAIELAPNFALAYNNRARTNYEPGNYDESIVDADKALKLKPNEVMFYDTRACAYKGLQRYDDALADLNKAIQISAEGWLYKRRAEIYQLVGDETKAQADFDEAARLG